MRTCRVCNSADMPQIEADLVAGATLAVVAHRYGIHRDAVSRHRTNHGLNPALVALTPARTPVIAVRDVSTTEEATDRPPVDQLVEKLKQTEEIQRDATERHNAAGALQATRQASALIEQIARIRGQLDRPAATTIDILGSVEWDGIRSAMLRVFDKNPGELVTRHQVQQELADALGDHNYGGQNA